jgi:hypothetical protein
MDTGGYKIRNQREVHFITFAVMEWVDVFTRKDYRDILLDSIRYCQNERFITAFFPDESPPEFENVSQ